MKIDDKFLKNKHINKLSMTICKRNYMYITTNCDSFKVHKVSSNFENYLMLLNTITNFMNNFGCSFIGRVFI